MTIKSLQMYSEGAQKEAPGLDFGWSGDTVTGSSRATLSPRPCSINKQLRKSRVEAPTRALETTHARTDRQSAPGRLHGLRLTLGQPH